MTGVSLRPDCGVTSDCDSAWSSDSVVVVVVVVVPGEERVGLRL